MKLSSIFNRIYVFPFYKKYSGLFFFLIVTFLFSLVFVGALGELPNDKKLYWNLILTIKAFSNPYVAILIFMLAGFYIYKSVNYLINLLHKSENLFLYQTYGGISFKKSVGVLLSSFFKVFMPLYLYSLFSFLVGALFHFWIIPVIFLLFIIAVHILLSVVFAHKLAYGKVDQISRLNIQRTAIKNKSIEFIFLLYILHEQKLVFIINKIISLVFIIVVFDDGSWQYGLRGIALVTLFISLTHSSIQYQWFKFKSEQLDFSNNLPFSFTSSYLGVLVPYLFILMPEIFLIIRYTNIYYALFGITVLASLCLLFWTILDRFGMNIKTFFKSVLGIGFLLYFLFLYNLEMMSIIIILVLTVSSAMSRYYLKET
ncbi:hypothetical protein [Arachidicoccus sp.]|uniref:hypothetical protein n=1 Tax=Arachidicoccus sp. TaxID=1872624 RepID=UPI003D1A8B84